MSDGLPERRDGAGAFLGDEEVRRQFARVAARPEQEVVDHLLAAAEVWVEEAPLHDDLTLVVLRIGAVEAVAAMAVSPEEAVRAPLLSAKARQEEGGAATR